VRGSAGPRH